MREEGKGMREGDRDRCDYFARRMEIGLLTVACLPFEGSLCFNSLSLLLIIYLLTLEWICLNMFKHVRCFNASSIASSGPVSVLVVSKLNVRFTCREVHL